MVENHHNFAWKEKWEGKDVIVHRKGATPAGKDAVSYTHLRAHETVLDIVCRLLLDKKKHARPR